MLLSILILCTILILISLALGILRKNQIEQDKNIKGLLDVHESINKKFMTHHARLRHLEDCVLEDTYWGKVNSIITEKIHNETDYQFKSLQDDIQNFDKSLLSEEFIDKVVDRIKRKQLND